MAHPAAAQPLSEEYLREYAPLFECGPKMRGIRELIEQVAPTSATVLIRGESGVGKCIVARALHAASPRHAHPFVKVNCAALPGELLEAELFGHERGAFTGAWRRQLGKFEFANHGAMFLDEIGELPRPLQAKLLHVLQDMEFSRIGGRETIRVDARVISSTNRQLEAAIERGEFREDLYYRLNVVEIIVPPLRDRVDEIPALAAHLVAKLNDQYRRDAELTPDLLELFMDYYWPGNVRELENTLRRFVVLRNPAHVKQELLSRIPRSRSSRPGPTEAVRSPAGAEPDGPGLGLREIARRAAQEGERRALLEVLEQVHWNRKEAARILKVSYKTLLNKIAECGLAGDRPRRSKKRPSPTDSTT